jgi:threonine dehydrogenase-like Zn-dependent dehydrogenase
VGTGQSMATAFAIARPGSIVGAIGAPHGVEVPIDTVIFRNIGLRGGVSPVRRYIPELLPDVLEGRIDPGRVFDFETDLDGIVEGTLRWTKGARSSHSYGWHELGLRPHARSRSRFSMQKVAPNSTHLTG